MNTILHKVQTYLDKVSREPVVISEELVDAFGESCKAILRKQFSEERQSEFKPRMSNIGRPLCQLQMEAKGIKGEGQPYSNKMRNTFGDLIEALSIFVMKSAGVEIKNEQKEVTHKFGKQSIDGKQDVEIDVKEKPTISQTKKNEAKTFKKESYSKLKDKKNYEITKYKPRKSLSFTKLLSYLIVLLITFVALLVIIDTFSAYLYQLFPSLELFIFSLFEILKDIKLFIKDLI